ncbi:hypothetical protein CRG98_042257 [Punica granatum]|uniref:Uncharacterized protein n=1 Tax=Punica granatum TaxID=22663 RepID=A0A2I0I076_PUNGR|nr:hypothetical protein CRG98_042257 [Punica granatum]
MARMGLQESYRVDPYNPAKITENRTRLEIRTRLAPVGSDVAAEAPDGILRQVGSDVATEAPDGIVEQGQRLPTANSPLEVAMVVVFQKESWIDPIYKKTVQTVRNFDPTGQSGVFSS